MSEHTPTPWWIADAKGIVLGPDNRKVATTYVDGRTFEETYTDAAFIVKAVNNHDALVKALQQIIDGSQNKEIGNAEFRVKAAQSAQGALAVVGPAVCAKCGCETKGEVALVHEAEWCHPCADKADINASVGEPTK